MTEWIFLSLASLLAGFFDAIVGGGGLVLVPALFAAFPVAPAATLFGSNKAAAIWGTGMAAWQYGRRVRLCRASLAPAMACCALGAFCGALAVTFVRADFLRRLLPFLLLGVLLYTFAHKQFGQQHRPRHAPGKETRLLCAAALALGGYDGFFGPGTGSFLIFVLVHWLGYDFLRASAATKLLNLASNVAAIALFALKGHVWWHLAAPMALANVLGAVLGARLALRHGAGFVRVVFLLVVVALIARTGYDAFWPAL